MLFLVTSCYTTQLINAKTLALLTKLRYRFFTPALRGRKS